MDFGLLGFLPLLFQKLLLPLGMRQMHLVYNWVPSDLVLKPLHILPPFVDMSQLGLHGSSIQQKSSPCQQLQEEKIKAQSITIEDDSGKKEYMYYVDPQNHKPAWSRGKTDIIA